MAYFAHRRIIGVPGIQVAIALLFTFTAPSAAGVMLTPEAITLALRRHALENSPWTAQNVEVRVLSFQPVSLHSVATKLRVLRPVNGISPGQQSFLIAAESEGKEQARVWVKADVRVFEEVVVSSKPMVSNEIVTGKDVRIERRDVSGLNARPFYRLDDVVGQQVSRAVSMNEALTQRNLERPTLIRRSNIVMLVYETGALRVETPGTAEENGRAGELIQVKNASSGKLLRGRLVDGRTVRVER
jgi:flagella basal body P-ring formation protein FlgA